jgi:hypothetical protein
MDFQEIKETNEMLANIQDTINRQPYNSTDAPKHILEVHQEVASIELLLLKKIENMVANADALLRQNI